LTTTHFFLKYGVAEGVVLVLCLIPAYLFTNPKTVSRRHRRIAVIGWLACWLFITGPVMVVAFLRWEDLHQLGTPGHVSRHSGWEAGLIALGLWIASIVIMRICRKAARRERKKMELWNSRQPLRQKARREFDSQARHSRPVELSA